MKENSREEWKRKCSELLKKAKESKDVMEYSEVEAFFEQEGFKLTEKQLAQTCAVLESQGIDIIRLEDAQKLADELEEELSEIEKVIEAQRLVGNYDMKQICMTMVKQDHEERQGREMTTGAK